MKILVYIEPHPIRENPLEFLQVATKFARMVDANEQFASDNSGLRIFCNPPIYNTLLKFGFRAETLACLIKPDNKTWKEVLTYFGDWNEDGIEQWRNLIAGKGRISRYYEELLKKLVRKYDFDHIVTWGNNGAVKNISMEFALRHTVIELGAFRKPIGSSIQAASLNSKGNYVQYESHDVPEALVSSDYLIKKYKSFLKVFSLRIKFFACVMRFKKKRTVLIPLQLMDDANVVFYSKYKSMENFLQTLLPHLKKYRVFVKPHPSHKVRQINSDDHKLCKQLIGKFDNVSWLSIFKSSKHNPQLIGLFDKVIGINSSLLFEGVILDKKVLYFGDCNFFDQGAPLMDLNSQSAVNYRIAKIAEHKNILLFEEKTILEYTNFLSLISIPVN